jgi:protein-disulfide isomerase
MKQLLYPISSNDHVFGNTAASLELLEYGDYECPYCGRAYPIVKEIQQQLGGDLKFVFRNFPLSKIHPNAFFAAVATEAAGVQGKFWEMHDIIFENQRTLDTEIIFRFAAALDLDIHRFKDDVQQENLIEKVEKDFESGLRSGVNGTPTFFINGEKYDGAWIDAALLQHLKIVLAGMRTSHHHFFIQQ